jgi:hypothetical protein
MLFWPLDMEAAMSGILDKFHVEHSTQGARVIARSPQLSGFCGTDSEIDTAVEMLKDDLDACAREMKRLLDVNNRGSMFEGWPKAGDGVIGA